MRTKVHSFNKQLLIHKSGNKWFTCFIPYNLGLKEKQNINADLGKAPSIENETASSSELIISFSTGGVVVTKAMVRFLACVMSCEW